MIVALGIAAGCHYGDMVAFRNDTGRPLTLNVTFARRFARYNCAERSIVGTYATEVSATAAPSETVCFLGPYGPEVYNAVEDVKDVVMSVEGAACFRGPPASLKQTELTVGEYKYRGFAVDEATCRPAQ